MAEPRRVPLLPAKPSVSNEKTPSSKVKESKQNGNASDGKTNADKAQKSIRLEISLSTSNEKHCPEYSYLDLIKDKVGLGSSIKQEQKTGLDPFDEDDGDELKALAKKFEDKYGPKQGSGKKAKKRKYDSNPYHHDIGYGYDESDPFVDNTEAYDELVPADWTTQHGGFYINQGELHYRPMADSDLKDFKSPKKKRFLDGKKAKTKAGEKTLSKTPKELSTQKRKKQLLSKEKKQKKLENALASQKVKKRKLKQIMDDDTSDSPTLSQIKNASITSSPNEWHSASPKTVANGTALNVSGGNLSNSQVKTKKLGFVSPSEKSESPSSQNSDKYHREKGALNNGNVYTKNQLGKDLNYSTSSIEPPSVCTDAGLAKTSQSGTETPKESRKEAELPSSPPNLPENLPLILEAGIQNLKDAAANCQNGKCRFFDVSVNKTLLGVARTLAKLPCKVRTTVYDHLAFYLPCSKETLVKRAKTLMIEDQVNQLDAPMTQLKEAIDKEMPHQKKSYDAEVANALTERVREQMKQSGFPSTNDDDASLDKSSATLDEKDSSIISETATTTTATSEERVKKTMPKRKFSWTDQIRKLLCDVVSVKVQLYKMSKSRSMTAEEYIKDFLENDVRKFWPKGWMTSRILFKESKSAHQEITQPTSKAKKEKPMKKPEAPPAQRFQSSSNLEQPKLKPNSSMTNLLEASNHTVDMAELKPKLSIKKESETKAIIANTSFSTALPQKSSGKSIESPSKQVAKFAVVSREIANKNENKLPTATQDVASYNQSDHSKSPASKSSNFNVIIGNPFEKINHTKSSTPTSDVINYSKANRVASGLKTDAQIVKPASKSAKHGFEKPVHSILDYASGDPLRAPGVSSTVHAALNKVIEASRTKQPQKLTPVLNATASLQPPQLPSQLHQKWTQHARDTELSATCMPPVSTYSMPLQHAPSQVLTAAKHDTQSAVPKPVYKTPPKDQRRSLSVTPPKSSTQNISPRAVGSAAASRRSPLLHFPSKIEQQRRLSGHSQDELRNPQGALSHSITRITRDPSSQQGTYTSMAYSNVISSHSNSMSMPKMQSGSSAHDPMHTLNQQAQGLSAPSPMDILFQQTQIHLKQQQALQKMQQQQQQQQQQKTLQQQQQKKTLQQQQQQKAMQQQQQKAMQQQQQNALQQQQQKAMQQQQQQSMQQQNALQQQQQNALQQQQQKTLQLQQQQKMIQQQQHAQQLQSGQGLDMDPEQFNLLASLPFQGSSSQDQYPGPFSNFRPQFI